jgi:hypothetical protein
MRGGYFLISATLMIGHHFSISALWDMPSIVIGQHGIKTPAR